MTEESSHSTLSIGLRLLELLRQHEDGLLSSDLQAATGMSSSSLFILLNELKTLGYIRQPDKRGRYFIGIRLQSLVGCGTPGPQAVIDAFNALAKGFMPEYTLLLTSALGNNWLVQSARVAESPLRVVYLAGELLPASDAQQRLFEQAIPKKLLNEGYNLDQTDGVVTLAVPLAIIDLLPRAAILLFIPEANWNKNDLEQIVGALKLLAAELSSRLGAKGYLPFGVVSSGVVPAMRDMSIAEINDFLKGPWIAKLAFLHPNCYPHILPVWQHWDEQKIYLPVLGGSQWRSLVEQQPLVTLSIDEPWKPFRRVVIRGNAKHGLRPAQAGYKKIIRSLARRFLGVPNLPPDFIIEQLFVIEPEVITGRLGL